MIRSGATYRATYSVGHVRISEECLNPRPWEKFPHNGNHLYPLTNFPDAVYTEDWERFIKTKAGPDGVIMKPDGYRYMDDELRQSLQEELDRLNEIVNPSPSEITLKLRIIDTFKKLNDTQVENDVKASRVLQIMDAHVSPEIRVASEAIKTQFSEQPELQMRSLLNQMRTSFHFEPHVAKAAMNFHLENMIGTAFDLKDMNLLFTALIDQQQRQERILRKNNPAVEEHRLGLIANNVLIQTANEGIGGYLAANQALQPVLAIGEMGPLPEGPHPPATTPLVFIYPMPGAEAQRGAFNAQMHRWELDVIADDIGNADVDHFPVFTLTPAEIPPKPPARINLSDTSPPTTPEEFLRIMIEKTDSSTGSEIYMARQDLVKASQASPNPSLTTLHENFKQYMRANPKSKNYLLEDLHTAHAQGQGGSAFARGSRTAHAHNVHECGYGVHSANASADDSFSIGTGNYGGGLLSASASSSNAHDTGYGPQIRQMGQASGHASAAALTKSEIDAMTNDQLGKRVREDAMREGRGYPCHYWGYINGQLACGAEMALGVCNYRQFHFPDHTGPPAKTFDRTRSSAPAPGMPGLYLRPSGSM